MALYRGVYWSMPKKIAVFVDVFPPPFTGGAEETTLQETELFLSLGYEVEVYALRPWYKQKSTRPENSGINVKEYSDFPYHPAFLQKKPFSLVRIIWHLSHVVRPSHLLQSYINLRVFKPDLIYCGNITGWGITPWVLSQMLHITKVQVVHDYGFICFKKTLMRRDMAGSNCGGKCVGCRPRRALTRLLWKDGLIVFVSKRQRELYRASETFTDNSKSLIQYPILLNMPKWAHNQRKFDYGYIGRISPEKGLENLLKVFQSKSAILHIAGTGQEKYISELKKISPLAVFHGYMDKWEFLKEVKLLIVPSVWEEPAGRIVREAIGSGCNLAVSKYGGLQEMGNMTGVRLMVFDPLSDESINEILTRRLIAEKYEIPTGYQAKLVEDGKILQRAIGKILNAN